MPLEAAIAQFASAVPDEPAWVDVRGALLCGRSTVLTGAGAGFVIVTPHIPLVCVVGQPEPDVIHRAVAAAGEARARLPVLAVEPAAAELVVRTLPEWRRGVAILHTRSGPLPDPPPGVVVRWSEPSAPLSAAALEVVPPAMRDDLLDAVRYEPVSYVAVGDQAVAFCYAPWRTERWFDISVDTIERWQRRGLALACARALIARLEAEGLGAVWGAHEGNRASLALAARLGFVPVAQISVFERAPA